MEALFKLVRAHMNCFTKCYAKWSGVAGTAFFSASAFASSPMPAIGDDNLAVVAVLGAIVGVLGAAFKVKAGLLLPRSLLVATIVIFVVQVAMNGGILPLAIMGAVILIVPFMLCLSSAYGLVRLLIRLNSIEIR